jgi:hypothetical protein
MSTPDYTSLAERQRAYSKSGNTRQSPRFGSIKSSGYGWHIDEASKGEIAAILKRCITDRVSLEFMAPPAKQPVQSQLSTRR